MKCLESHTIEQVKKMSYEELKLLWEKMVEEKQTMDMRRTIIDLIGVVDANKIDSAITTTSFFSY